MEIDDLKEAFVNIWAAAVQWQKLQLCAAKSNIVSSIQICDTLENHSPSIQRAGSSVRMLKKSSSGQDKKVLNELLYSNIQR